MSDQSQANQDDVVVPLNLMELIEMARVEEWKELDLSNWVLRELPAEISQLTQLESLILIKRTDLWRFELRRRFALRMRRSIDGVGTFPLEILCLKNLTNLAFGYMGSDLPETIGQLSRLQNLTIFAPKLSKFPESIARLKKIQCLELWRFNLESLPQAITKLTSLQTLNLIGSKIKSLPEDIGQLRNLKNLDLSGSQIELLPENIGQLVKLEYLGLRGTPLSSLPVSISQLENLKKLDLGGFEDEFFC